jgi:hypothetical protein
MRVFLVLLSLTSCLYVHAATVFLKDGQSAVGEVIWRGRAGLELRIAEGCVGEGQKIFIEANRIESVEYCAASTEWGINEVPESRLEFEKRMALRGRVFYKGRWIPSDERDADEARIKAEHEKAAAKDATPVAPLTPATPRAAPNAQPVTPAK